MSLWDQASQFLMAHNPFATPQPQTPAAPPAPMGATAHMQATNDAMARRLGFSSAAQAAGYYQHQQDMRTGPVPSPDAASSGGWMDRYLTIHPAVLMNKVIDGFNQAGQ